MKITIGIIYLVCALAIPSTAQIIGRWTSIDDASGKPRSIVEISERAGKFFGKVVRVFPQPGEAPDPVCDKCDNDDSRFNQKIIGMEIIKDLVRDGEDFAEGTILDPENGKVYRCKLWLEGKLLKVRGYWGPFFRTQTWKPDGDSSLEK